MDWASILPVVELVAQILVPLVLLIGVRIFRDRVRQQGQVEESRELLQLLDWIAEMAVYQIEAWAKGALDEVSSEDKRRRAVELTKTLLIEQRKGGVPFSDELITAAVERALGVTINVETE